MRLFLVLFSLINMLIVGVIAQKWIQIFDSKKKRGRIQFNVQIEVPSSFYYFYFNFKNKRNREKGISVICASPHSVATIYTPELQKLGIKSPKFLRWQGSRRTNVHRANLSQHKPENLLQRRHQSVTSILSRFQLLSWFLLIISYTDSIWNAEISFLCVNVVTDRRTWRRLSSTGGRRSECVWLRLWMRWFRTVLSVPSSPFRFSFSSTRYCLCFRFLIFRLVIMHLFI